MRNLPRLNNQGNGKGETKIPKEFIGVDAPKYPNIVVALVGEDGNAVAIMGRVANAMRKAGVAQEEINEYLDESMSGDYDNLLRTAIKWVATEQIDVLGSRFQKSVAPTP